MPENKLSAHRPLIRHPACVRRRTPPSPEGKAAAAAGRGYDKHPWLPLGEAGAKRLMRGGTRSGQKAIARGNDI